MDWPSHVWPSPIRTKASLLTVSLTCALCKEGLLTSRTFEINGFNNYLIQISELLSAHRLCLTSANALDVKRDLDYTEEEILSTIQSAKNSICTFCHKSGAATTWSRSAFHLPCVFRQLHPDRLSEDSDTEVSFKSRIPFPVEPIGHCNSSKSNILQNETSSKMVRQRSLGRNNERPGGAESKFREGHEKRSCRYRSPLGIAHQASSGNVERHQGQPKSTDGKENRKSSLRGNGKLCQRRLSSSKASTTASTTISDETSSDGLPETELRQHIPSDATKVCQKNVDVSCEIQRDISPETNGNGKRNDSFKSKEKQKKKGKFCKRPASVKTSSISGAATAIPDDVETQNGEEFVKPNPTRGRKRKHVESSTSVAEPSSSRQQPEAKRRKLVAAAVKTVKVDQPVNPDRLYYTLDRNQLMEGGIFDDEEDNFQWYYDNWHRRIDAFEDVNEGEKEIMKLWNEFSSKFMPSFGATFIPECLVNFVEQLGEKILRNNLYRNTVLHIFNLVDFELISPVQSFDAIKRLQQVFSRVMTQEQEQNQKHLGVANQPQADAESQSTLPTVDDNFRLFISDEECENEEDEVSFQSHSESGSSSTGGAGRSQSNNNNTLPSSQLSCESVPSAEKNAAQQAKLILSPKAKDPPRRSSSRSPNKSSSNKSSVLLNAKSPSKNDKVK